MTARGIRTRRVLAACVAVLAAGAAQQAAAQRAAAQPSVPYTTREGDTLYDIAGRYLLGIGDWTIIARLNRVPEPRHLQPGVVLKLPVSRLRSERLSARVVAAHGSVVRASRGSSDFEPVGVDAQLTEGDRLRTGADGFATLELADGTHMSLPPDSQVDLATLRRTVLTGTLVRVIDLTRGSIDSDVTHMKRRDDRFQIRSPSVVAGVRGTRFRVAYDTEGAAGGARTLVEVLDGAVGVAHGHRSAALGVLVPASYGNVSRANGEVGAPISLLDAPRLVEPGKVQDGPKVAFALAPLEGARAYRVEIARDAGFLDVIRDARVRAPQANFANVVDGTYFVRAAAIDANGLEGRPRIYAFERRQFGLAASAGPAGGGYAFRWTPSAGPGAQGVPTRYRFVLSASKDLRDPLVDEVDLTGERISVAHLPPGDYYWTVIAEQFQNGRFYQKAGRIDTFTIAR